jgi:hypothetical protein
MEGGREGKRHYRWDRMETGIEDWEDRIVSDGGGGLGDAVRKVGGRIKMSGRLLLPCTEGRLRRLRHCIYSVV